VAFALLTPYALFHAAHLHSSPAIGGLVVESDPDYAATQAFHQVFPEGHTALLLAESDAPLSAASLTELDRLTQGLKTVPGVTPVSVLEVYRRAHPGFTPATSDLTDFARFASSPLLRRQGLVGPHFMSIAASFPEKGADARDRTLSGIDAALAKVQLSTLHKLRRVGAPYVESWIERESREAQLRGLPVLALLIVILCWILYRSLRAVFAFLLSLASARRTAPRSILDQTFTPPAQTAPVTQPNSNVLPIQPAPAPGGAATKTPTPNTKSP